jgi:DNA-binding MarR family transcriptional regulator
LHEEVWDCARVQKVSSWPDPDLTLPQLKALMMLSAEPLRMTDIAERLDIHLSSATTLMDRIISKGLAERLSDPDDRRVVLCHISSEGRAVVERFAEQHRLDLDDVAAYMTEDELAVLCSAMQVMLKAFRARAADASPRAVPGI